jgi:hypothetical protein
MTSWQSCAAIWNATAHRSWSVVVEFAPDAIRVNKTLWPRRSIAPQDGAFVMMEKVKDMFDPQHLLNRSRLYGQI